MTDERIPVGVFAYNRPQHLRLTLEALGRSGSLEGFEFHVFCDAPRTPEAADGVEQVRGVAREWVNNIGGELILREENMGFGNLTAGINDLCARYGWAIVIEDDIVVAPDFLDYMRAGLERYRDEPKVSMITGFMFQVDNDPKPGSLFISFASVWGWATWKRAWDQYERTPSGWRDLLNDPAERRRFDLDGRFGFYGALEGTQTGKLDTWDVQWYYAMFKAGGLCLAPWRSLVWNTGCGSGVHFTGGPDLDRRLEQFHGDQCREDYLQPRLGSGWAFPEQVEVDADAMRRIGECLAAGGKRRRFRWARKIGQAVQKMCACLRRGAP